MNSEGKNYGTVGSSIDNSRIQQLRVLLDPEEAFEGGRVQGWGVSLTLSRFDMWKLFRMDSGGNRLAIF